MCWPTEPAGSFARRATTRAGWRRVSTAERAELAHAVAAARACGRRSPRAERRRCRHRLRGFSGGGASSNAAAWWSSRFSSSSCLPAARATAARARRPRRPTSRAGRPRAKSTTTCLDVASGAGARAACVELARGRDDDVAADAHHRRGSLRSTRRTRLSAGAIGPLRVRESADHCEYCGHFARRSRAAGAARRAQWHTESARTTFTSPLAVSTIATLPFAGLRRSRRACPCRGARSRTRRDCPSFTARLEQRRDVDRLDDFPFHDVLDHDLVAVLLEKRPLSSRRPA